MQHGGIIVNPDGPGNPENFDATRHLKIDHDLEFQGVYRNDKAKDMACFRDCLAECTPDKCMAWRRVDAEHGYCVFVGCSWRKGLGA